MTRLILASSSPYRRALLERLRIPFVWDAPDIDETPVDGERPEQLVRRLSLAKARRVMDRFEHETPSLVIGCDQICLREGKLIGKPNGRQQAIAQLRAAAGRRVDFVTGLSVIDKTTGRFLQSTETAQVKFRELDAATIRAYVDAEKPYDTTGACKVEGLGIALIAEIQCPDPTALIGLPLIQLTDFLTAMGLAPLRALSASHDAT